MDHNYDEKKSKQLWIGCNRCIWRSIVIIVGGRGNEK